MDLIKKIFYLFILISSFACKKVIEIDVKGTDSKYVIEGTLSNEVGSCKVVISRTNPFYADNNFEMISGAIVKLKDNGTEYLLTEGTPGVYQKNITGIPLHIYQLSVSINNEVFTATCTMPQPVVMDTLYISPGPFGQFKFATIAFTDPPGLNNSYRFVQYVNGQKDPRIFWENDEFTDGEKVVLQLDTGVDKKTDPRNIKSGDEVSIEMQCVDNAIYKYWYSLRTGGGDGSSNTAAPANPLTNITGGALGYFSAYTTNRKTVIAP